MTITNEPIRDNKSTYMVAKDKDGVIQIIDGTATSDSEVATRDADKKAMENGSDYLVVKLVSRHKKRVTTEVIKYE